MATKVTFKTTFEAAKTIEPIFTGGDISHNANGNLLATCVEDDVLVVEIRTGNVRCRIEGDGEPVTSLCLAPNASHLVIASRSLSLRIYSLTAVQGVQSLNAQLLRTVKPHTTPVVSSAIDPSGSLLATGGADGQIKVWDIRGGYASHTFHGHGGVVSALKFFTSKSATTLQKSRKRKSRDGEQMDLDDESSVKQICLASAGEDGKIRIWNLAARKSIATLDSHVSVVRSLDFSDSQQLLLSASRDRTIILWDAATWKQQRVIPALEVLETSGFLSDGRFCFSGGELGAVRLWDVNTGRELTVKPKPGLENDAVTAIVPVVDDDTILSVHQDQTMRVHSLVKLRGLQTPESLGALPLLRTISGNYDEVIDMACVGPERNFLALATNTEGVRLISISDGGAPQHPFGNDVALLEGHSDIIICMDVDWSGRWLATGAKDNTARLWRIDPSSSTYTCVAILAGHAESLGAIALPRSAPSDGPSLKDPASHPPAFLLTGSQDKTIKRWDTSKLRFDLANAEPNTGTKAFFTRVAHEKDINALDVSPKNQLFASASQDRTIKIWSLDDGSVAGILRGHKRGVWSIRFSPAGSPPIPLADGGSSGSRGLLVSGSGDRSVKVWSLATYTCLLSFEGHSGSVLKVLWIPPSNSPAEGKKVADDEEGYAENEGAQRLQSQGHNRNPIIASASADTLIKLWSPYSAPDSDHLLTTLDNHTDRVWALAAPTSYPPPPPPHSKPKRSTSKTASDETRTFPLISGAADATLSFWTDTTLQTASHLASQQSQRIEQDQLLQNHIFTHNYREAITLSLSLDHPGRLLRVFQDVVVNDGNTAAAEDQEGRENGNRSQSITGHPAVDDTLASLSHEQLFRLLEHVRDWNTNARTAPVAQRVLNCLLKRHSRSTFVDMAREAQRRTFPGGGEATLPKDENGDVGAAARGGRKVKGKNAGGVRELLRALEVYTERHFKRMEELADESYLIDYTLGEMEHVTGAWNGTRANVSMNGDGDGDVLMV